MEKIKEHLQWWEKNLQNPEIEKKFEGWLSDSDIESRNKLFSKIIEKNINKVLEIGPGSFLDYHLFFSKNHNIKYETIDITKKIVENGLSMGVKCSQSSIEDIQYPDLSFELVYCRHVFEHLDYYTIALEEMLRVSEKYVVVIFWLLNFNDSDIISFDDNEKLYHNTYSKTKIENFLSEKNLNYNWEFCDTDIVLFIEKNYV